MKIYKTYLIDMMGYKVEERYFTEFYDATKYFEELVVKEKKAIGEHLKDDDLDESYPFIDKDEHIKAKHIGFYYKYGDDYDWDEATISVVIDEVELNEVTTDGIPPKA